MMRRFITIMENEHKAHFEVFSGADLIKLVDRVEPDLWDSKRIRYLLRSEARHESHIVAFVDDRIAGIAGLQTNPNDPQHLWIKFVSVDPDYQGRGLGRALLKRVYQYAVSHQQKIAPGSFTEDGERLAHLHDEFDAAYPEAAFRRGPDGSYLNDRGQKVR